MDRLLIASEFGPGPRKLLIRIRPVDRLARRGLDGTTRAPFLSLADWSPGDHLFAGALVFFARVTLIEIGALKLCTPAVSTLDWRVVALSAMSGYLLLYRHWGIPSVLGAAAAVALLFRVVGV
ncbi:MAG: hypothetical protein Q8K85_12585 [Hyphomicrobium sp.]|nr:hypothetical protein [Hyphomicrobium sp.]